MGLPNGLHHIAISVGDIKGQIEFFTQVCGMEMVALYWMHGVDQTFHCFLKMNDTCSIALVHNEDIPKIEPVSGVSYPSGWTGDNTAPGTMQHLALNVDTDEELFAMRDRLRANGYWVYGPLDHGMFKSIYFKGLENLMLEFASSEGRDTDPEMWVDPEVVELIGISPEELKNYKAPPPFVSQGGAIQNPEVDLKDPPMVFANNDQKIYGMTDEEVTAQLSEPTPPVPRK